jgi:hypothetical protein
MIISFFPNLLLQIICILMLPHDLIGITGFASSPVHDLIGIKGFAYSQIHDLIGIVEFADLVNFMI